MSWAYQHDFAALCCCRSASAVAAQATKTLGGTRALKLQRFGSSSDATKSRFYNEAQKEDEHLNVVDKAVAEGTVIRFA